MKKEELIKNNKKRAFSVMEIMIALVIVTIIFAAAAPFMTKRRVSTTYGKASVWKDVFNKSDVSYFYPGDNKLTSTAYFGLDPTAIKMKSPSRVVLKANDETIMPTGAGPQRMITFRKNEIEAGSLFMDSDENLLLGTPNSTLVNSHSSNNSNTVVGMGALGNVTEAANVTAIGASAASGSSGAKYNKDAYLIAVGSYAGESIAGTSNTLKDSGIYIGANAGRYSTSAKNNIVIGSDAMSSKNTGNNSIVIGYNAGNITASTTGDYDIKIGNDTITKYTSRHLLIGKNAGQDAKYATDGITFDSAGAGAIGSGTCSSAKALCIGYKSGYNHKNIREGGVYLGGLPNDTSPGDAILEVFPAKSGYNTDTVIMNSNLVVRGNIFMSDPTLSNNKFLVNNYSPNSSLLTVNSDSWLANYINNGYPSDKKVTYAQTCSGGIWQWNGVPSNPPNYGPLGLPPSQNSFAIKTSGGDALSCNEANNYNFNAACPQITSSDIRLKQNIVPSKIGLNELKKLVSYNFTFKDDKEKVLQVGVIAQNLQKVFPTSVTKDNKGFLHIRWDEMFFAMINALKELNTRIIKITNQIAEIKENLEAAHTNHENISKRIKDLDKRITRLERR